MQLNSTIEIIEDLRQGKMIILMDDQDRENEGDIIMVAEQVRPEDINFMATHARGLICLTLTKDHCERLALPLMVSNNGAAFETNFTMSIEAATGVTTGISAADRAHTVRTAVNANVKPTDIVQPGHVFPIMARDGGVMVRAGHTEAGCDLARLAGFAPAAVIVEVMNKDGTMARRDDLVAFAQTHGLKIGTIADLIQFRSINERTVEKIEQYTVDFESTVFDLHVYRDAILGNTHIAMTLGEVDPNAATLVRVHTPDMLLDIIGASNGQAKWTAQAALKRIATEGAGVMVILGRSETRVGASIESFFNPESSAPKSDISSSGAYLNVGLGAQILSDLGVHKMRLMSSEMKYNAISGFALEIEEYISSEA